MFTQSIHVGIDLLYTFWTIGGAEAGYSLECSSRPIMVHSADGSRPVMVRSDDG